ncbi:phosphoglycerate kinase [Candidatus Omnitrophota bacterium]
MLQRSLFMKVISLFISITFMTVTVNNSYAGNIVSTHNLSTQISTIDSADFLRESYTYDPKIKAAEPNFHRMATDEIAEKRLSINKYDNLSDISITVIIALVSAALSINLILDVSFGINLGIGYWGALLIFLLSIPIAGNIGVKVDNKVKSYKKEINPTAIDISSDSEYSKLDDSIKIKIVPHLGLLEYLLSDKRIMLHEHGTTKDIGPSNEILVGKYDKSSFVRYIPQEEENKTLGELGYASDFESDAYSEHSSNYYFDHQFNKGRFSDFIQSVNANTVIEEIRKRALEKLMITPSGQLIDYIIKLGGEEGRLVSEVNTQLSAQVFRWSPRATQSIVVQFFPYALQYHQEGDGFEVMYAPAVDGKQETYMIVRKSAVAEGETIETERAETEVMIQHDHVDYSQLDKPILVGANFDVVKKGKIADPTKVIRGLQGFENIDNPLVFVTHNGRPLTKGPEGLGLEPIIELMREKLPNKKIRLASGLTGESVADEIRNLKRGEVLLLENFRLDPRAESQVEAERKALVREIVYGDSDEPLFSLFISNAFASAPRLDGPSPSTSLIDFPALLPSVVGPLMLEELTMMEPLKEISRHPFALMTGGAKIGDKINATINPLKKMQQGDLLVIYGQMAFTYLQAQAELQGNSIDLGNSLIEWDYVEKAKEILKLAQEKGVRVILPLDHIETDDIDNPSSEKTRATEGLTISEGLVGGDVGPKTIEAIREAIKDVKLIFNNGTAGVFKTEELSKGTISITHLLLEAQEAGVDVIVGGGDAVDALKAGGVADKIKKQSTGGGSSLQIVGLAEGEEWVPVVALKKAAQRTFISDIDKVTRMLGKYQTTGPREEEIPDVYLIPGHPHALTIIEFAKQYNKLFSGAEKKPSLYLLGGRGNGTSRLIEGVLSHYYPRGSVRDLDRDALESPTITEAEVMEIIFRKEGVIENIYLDTTSVSTMDNFINAKELLHAQFKNPKKPIHVRIITVSEVVLRQYEYAWKTYKDEIGSFLELSATCPIDREFTSLSVLELVRFVTERMGFPEEFRAHPSFVGEASGTYARAQEEESPFEMADLAEVAAASEAIRDGAIFELLLEQYFEQLPIDHFRDDIRKVMRGILRQRHQGLADNANENEAICLYAA